MMLLNLSYSATESQELHTEQVGSHVLTDVCTDLWTIFSHLFPLS